MVLVPVPVVIVPPGDWVIDHVPEDGSPERTTLPAANEHVGCVIVPTTGADGVDGCALITTLLEAAETHPDALVTVNV